MTKKNPVCIYHKADFDGLFCREIARRFIPNVELIGWDYGEPEPKVDPECPLYIMDLSVHGLMSHPKLVWIDHHKSAIERYQSSIIGYRIDGVAACRLAWQWFTKDHTDPVVQFGGLPSLEEYKERRVSEPWAVRLAGEYDIWDKRDANAELFQHGLRSESPPWGSLLDDHGGTVTRLLNQGRAIQYAKREEDASIIAANGFDLKWEGLNFLACNHARFNSQLFIARVGPQHDALLGFRWDGGKQMWVVSLYGAPGKPEHDLSKIASKYGGGGHKQACGFALPTLPFVFDGSDRLS